MGKRPPPPLAFSEDKPALSQEPCLQGLPSINQTSSPHHSACCFSEGACILPALKDPRSLQNPGPTNLPEYLTF